MGRKRSTIWRTRILAVLLLAALVGGGYLWWQGRHWRPDVAQFPQQGAIVGASDGAVAFDGLQAIGAGFVYLEASAGANGRDPSFGSNLAAVEMTDLPFGVIHAYDPCVPAEKQAANFLTIVPRDAEMLPPAIELDKTAEDCADPLAEVAVESELTTFLNQVEGHTGRSAVLKLAPGFEERYHIARSIERPLWLRRDWQQPDYAGRPWTLWTANAHYANEASEDPLRWVAVQP